jgi:hypothetical protein
MAAAEERASGSSSSVDLANKNYFGVGSHIKCRYSGGQVEGEVVAYQNSSRLLVIKAPASNGKASCSNIYLINADCVDKISVDDKSPVEGLKPIDFPKLFKRRDKAVALKRARIRALSADVAPEGRTLFLAIIKTIQEVEWEGDKIVVLKEVYIAPPYKVENVSGENDASLRLVKKIVEKHLNDQN